MTRADQQAHEALMRRAIELARQNPEAPFGALLVERASGSIVAEGFNHAQDDPTLHGEIDVIRSYAQSGGSGWSDLRLYTTAEPCPMCQGAILWAGIPEVVYGTSIETLKRLGWRQIDLRAEEVTRRASFAACRVVGGVLEPECDALFQSVIT